MTRPAEEEPTSSAALEQGGQAGRPATQAEPQDIGPAPGANPMGSSRCASTRFVSGRTTGTWSGMVMPTSSPTGLRRSPSSEGGPRPSGSRDEEASSHDDDGATIRRRDGRIVGHWV